MLIRKSEVTKIVLAELDRLDPVTLIMEDFGPGQGKLTIDCYGKAWTAYWGGMGDEGIVKFIHTANVDYIANKLTVIDKNVIDYDAISAKIGTEVDRDTLAFCNEDLEKHYGCDWYMDLPTTINHEYEYLCRIVSAVKDYLDSNI